MNNHEIIVLMSCIIIMMGLAVRLWDNVFRKPEMKPQKAICVKCKYCVKQWRFREFTCSCRTPEDKMTTNYITGKVYIETYGCDLRNKNGTCPDFKKVWWRL